MDRGRERVLITGCSSGIGHATARRLHDAGHQVIATARRPETLGDLPDGVVRLALDVCDPDSVTAAVAAATDAVGAPTVLVNNAGYGQSGPVEMVDDAAVQRQFDTNVFGPLRLIRAVLPAMRAQGDGRIVNIVGQAARHPHSDRLPSGTTNAAQAAMTKSIADGLARENIRVNAVCPQYVETELVGVLIDKEMRERGVDRETASAGFWRANVLKRMGTPEEVADTVAFLVSDRATFITGSTISVDGGYHRYVFG